MKRILIKLSGEALKNGLKNTDALYDHAFVDRLAAQLKDSALFGNQIALVVGAGNIWRGRQGGEMDRTSADRMGMLATVINAICLKDALERAGARASVMTAVPMEPFADKYSAEEAKARLERGEIVIFGAGLGIPYLSTDTTCAVRAREIDADVLLMAKNIDYIYTDDPNKNKLATKLERVKASEVLAMNLKAIDATATAFCLSVGMPIQVFKLADPADIAKAIKGETVGTVITAE